MLCCHIVFVFLFYRNSKVHIYMHVHRLAPPPHDLPSVGLGKAHRASETVTSRKSLAALVYCTICDVVSSTVSLHIRSLYVRSLD